MKRYIVFYGDSYYPRGGWLDLKEFFDSKDEAITVAEELSLDNYGWSHVVDTKDFKVIYGGA